MRIKMNEQLRLQLKAKMGLIYLSSFEEERIEDSFIKICKQLNYGLYVWDLNIGFKELLQDQYKSAEPNEEETSPNDALQEIQKYQGDAVFLLKDFQRFLDIEKWADAPITIRILRNLVRDLRVHSKNKSIVILAPTVNIPEDLEHDLTLIDFELPDYQTLRKSIQQFIAKNRFENKTKLSEENFEKLIKSMQGLTTVQAERAIAKIFVRHGKLKDHNIEEALAEKKQIISKTGILEYIEVQETMDDIGGLNSLKQWLEQREVAFSESAKSYGLPTPKGLLMIGVQGVGKSLTAKAVSARWNLPLVRLDVGRVFGSLVGESEEKIRRAIKIAEAISPCILWIDELDKAFAGVRGQQGDSGTSARVFGSLLTWMQEKTKPVFIVATANNVVRFIGKGKNKIQETLLPPELLRKGRFDELFFLDLPIKDERKEIFEIMTRKYNLTDDIDFDLLAEKSGGMVSGTKDLGFGGAEIEQIVIESMYQAFYDNERNVTTEDIMLCMNETRPLYDLMQEEIDNLRSWAKGRTRLASN